LDTFHVFGLCTIQAAAQFWKILVVSPAVDVDDTFIADFSVGVGATFIKLGSCAGYALRCAVTFQVGVSLGFRRLDRIAKCNRMLLIEDELGDAAVIAKHRREM
jgi:enolase